jgi:hypothetical protein
VVHTFPFPHPRFLRSPAQTPRRRQIHHHSCGRFTFWLQSFSNHHHVD